MDEQILAERLSEANHRLYITQPKHAVPSPSGVNKCIRMQWANGTDFPRTDFPSDSSIVKMQAGLGIEPYLRSVYEAAGYEVIPRDGRIPIFGGLMSGEIDWMIKDKGETFLIDSKYLGWYGYIKILMLGMPEGDPDYYAQMQSYLAGLPECSGAILHVSTQDYSAANLLWKKGFHQWRKQDSDLPDFYVVHIPPDGAEQRRQKERAEEVKFLVENEKDISKVRREYDPRAGKFPCTYCPIRRACEQVGA